MAQETPIQKWWALLEYREAIQKFVRETEERAKPYICFGAEHLKLESLRADGMKKVIKLSHNFAELQPPTSLSFDSLGVNEICDILGDKQKLSVLDPLEAIAHKRRINMQTREWKQYWAKKPAERHGVLSVHSFEFSRTPLGKLVRVPKAIAAIDWVTNLWPKDLKSKGEYPRILQCVGLYPAGSFTHFHIESGGSGLWYNVTKGSQIILLVPPTEKHLHAFKEWISKKTTQDKNAKFETHKPALFSEVADVTIRCDLKAGNSLVIPGGWAYAAFSCTDSVVFSGKFLSGYNFDIQLKIHAELDEKCPERTKVKCPEFEEMMWYVAEDYVRMMHEKTHTFNQAELDGLNQLAKFLKFYKIRKPASIFSCQFLEDSINNFNQGKELPNQTKYDADEEQDSVSNNNDECAQCNGKTESNLWVGCERCGNWYHAPCIGVSKKELDDLTNSEKDYVCYRCVAPDVPNPNVHIPPGPGPTTTAQPSQSDKKRKPNIEPPSDRIPKKPKV